METGQFASPSSLPGSRVGRLSPCSEPQLVSGYRLQLTRDQVSSTETPLWETSQRL